MCVCVVSILIYKPDSRSISSIFHFDQFNYENVVCRCKASVDKSRQLSQFGDFFRYFRNCIFFSLQMTAKKKTAQKRWKGIQIPNLKPYGRYKYFLLDILFSHLTHANVDQLYINTIDFFCKFVAVCIRMESVISWSRTVYKQSSIQ